jgi:Cu(I)/Ag(I) efflux system membrane fusion protein
MTKKAAIALLGLIILAVIFSYPHLTWRDTAAITPTTHSLPAINPTAQKRVLVCPMHPEIMQDHPGTCPICGMALVESKNAAAHDHGVFVDSATAQRLGVRLAIAKKSAMAREIQTFGNVTPDENALYSIHSKFDGWIRKSNINFIGQRIQKGQVIYEIYSPELIMQQKAYLTFLGRRDQILQTVGDVRLEENEYVMDLLQDLSRERTKFLHEDVGIDTIQRLEDSKQAIEIVKITAGASGVVTQINAREGSYVTPGATLFTLDNVSRVWVTALLYPDQAEQVKNGDEVIVATHDGQTFRSHVEFISPLADNNKVTARVSIGNSDLRPGTFVNVTIRTQPHQGLVVPGTAVLRTGEGNMVMLHRGEGHFIPVYVDTGVENSDAIEITDGLQPGSEVAVNGQFLLDSSASISAQAERMQSGKTMAQGMQDAR